MMNQSILTHCCRILNRRSPSVIQCPSYSSLAFWKFKNATSTMWTMTRVTTAVQNYPMINHHPISMYFLNTHYFSTTTLLSQKSTTTTWEWIRQHPKTVWGSILTLLVTGTTASLLYHVQDQVGGTEGLYRTLSFYSLAIPKYIQYRYHQYMDSSDEIWDTLHDETSKQGLEKILQLKGFYIKSGQMCAANFGNAFPPIWQRNMAILQDQCPHEDFHTVLSILRQEFQDSSNIPLEHIFSYIDPIPMGAASIGQVHRATLATKEGRKKQVVMKIMYPNVEGVFRGDVRTIKMFAQIAQPVHVPPLDEVEKQFMTEFDYKREAEQLNQVRLNLIQAGLAEDDDNTAETKNRIRRQGGRMEKKLCRIPKPYLEYCTKRVLVMEELKGIKLVDGLRQDLERHASRAGMSVDEFKALQENKTQKLMVEKRQGDSSSTSVDSSNRSNTKFYSQEKFGPTASEYEQYIRLLDVQRRMNNIGRRVYNYTLGLVPGFPTKPLEGKNILPLNHAKLIDDLIYIHGHEVLVDGMFNGDPHPGPSNVLSNGSVCVCVFFWTYHDSSLYYVTSIFLK